MTSSSVDDPLESRRCRRRCPARTTRLNPVDEEADRRPPLRCGRWSFFRIIAQRTGVSVSATTPESTMDAAIVIENWR